MAETDLVARPRRRSAPARRRTPGGDVISPITHRVEAAVAVLLVFAHSLWFTWGAGIVDADVVTLRELAERGLGDVMLAPVSGTQVAPGHRLLTAVLEATGPIDGRVMHVVVAMAAAATAAGVVLLMRELYGARHAGPATALVVGVGPAALHVDIWFAAAFHQRFGVLFGVLSVWAFLRGRDPGGRRWYLLSVGLFGLGLLFTVKVVAALVVIVGLDHLLTAQPRPALIDAVVSRRRTWAPFVLLLAGYLVMDRVWGTDQAIGGAAAVAATSTRAVADMLVPMLAGVSGAGTSLRHVPADGVLVVLAWLIVVGIVFVGHRRAPDTVGAVAIVVGVVLVTLVPSVALRIVHLGADAATAHRDHLEAVTYGTPLLLWGLLRPARTPGPPRGVGVRTLRRASLAGLGLVVVALSLWSDVLIRHEHPSLPSGEWLRTLAASVADQPGLQTRVPDLPLHPAVMRHIGGGTISDVAHLVPSLHVTATDANRVVTADGSIEPLRLEEVFRQSAQELSTNSLVVPPDGVPVEDEGFCTADELSLRLLVAADPTPRLVEVTTTGAPDLVVRPVAEGGGPTFTAPSDARSELGAPRLLPLDVAGDFGEVEILLRATTATGGCLSDMAIHHVLNDLPGSD